MDGGTIISGVEALATVVASIAACIAFCQWRHDQRISRQQMLKNLLEEFCGPDVQDVFYRIDEGSESGRDFLEAWKSDKNREKQLDKAFYFYSRLCYLKRMRVIADAEFDFFDYQIVRVLNNSSVRSYILRLDTFADGQSSRNPFQELVDYAINRHVPGWDRNIVDLDGYQKPVKGAPCGTAVKESDFTEPTLVVRINRLYEDGMPDDRLQEITRGAWRLNFYKAMQCKFLVAIARGEVKGVFAIGKIVEGSGSHKDRMLVESSPTDSAYKRALLGRSTRGLFKKGDANPVRYYGLEERK